MNKSQLEAGFLVMTRQKEVGILLQQSYIKGLSICREGGVITILGRYNNDMTHYKYPQFDIMEVYGFQSESKFMLIPKKEGRKLLWVRPPELTEEELEVLNALKVLKMTHLVRIPDTGKVYACRDDYQPIPLSRDLFTRLQIGFNMKVKIEKIEKGDYHE